jgi:hypothetical protein
MLNKLCAPDIYSKDCNGNHFGSIFCPSYLKQEDALFLVLSYFTLEFVIRRIQENQDV